jgi:energy-coupling factor transport system substrate-specific component
MNQLRPILLRPVLVYGLVVVVGAAAFLWPFFLAGHALPNQAHSGDAPLWAALVGAAVVAAIALEVRRGTMTGTTVALLGVLSAIAGLLRLLALPGGGNGIYFLVILAGVAFGPRFGLLLGLLAMAVSAVVTGGIGPWLPFQMLALSWMGAGAGFLGWFTRRLPPAAEVGVIAAYGWVWGFLYGAILNLWFWPFQVDGGALSYSPNLSTAQTFHHYYSFYVASSFAWDAAGALANAILIVLTGRALLRSLRRFAGRLDPIVELDPLPSAPEPRIREAIAQ